MTKKLIFTFFFIMFTKLVLCINNNSKNQLDAVLEESTIEPLSYICESLKVEATYGGIRLFWNNPKRKAAVIETYVVNDEDELVLLDTVITQYATSRSCLVLNQEPIETNYVVIVKAKFGGEKCNDKEVTLTPLPITLFDRNNYKAIYQKHDTPSDFGWILANTYDGIKGNQGYHSKVDWGGPDGELPEYENWSYNDIELTPTIITWDVGELVNLYRFKYWPRFSYHWNHFNPYLFDLWGTDKLNDDGSLEGWILLLENVGPPEEPSYGSITQDIREEDIEIAEAGFTFDISEDMPKVRYVRFVQKLAQDRKSSELHLSEIEFYGEYSTLSNDKFTLKDTVKLYPNPITDKLNIDNAQGLKVSIYSILGKEVLTSEIEQTNQTIDITSLKTGVYFVKIGNTNNSTTMKIVKL